MLNVIGYLEQSITIRKNAVVGAFTFDRISSSMVKSDKKKSSGNWVLFIISSNKVVYKSNLSCYGNDCQWAAVTLNINFCVRFPQQVLPNIVMSSFTWVLFITHDKHYYYASSLWNFLFQIL